MVEDGSVLLHFVSKDEMIGGFYLCSMRNAVLAVECYFLFSYTPYHCPAHRWVPVLPSLGEISPLLLLPSGCRCRHTLADVPPAGPEACWIQSNCKGHSYKWSLMRQLNVHPKGNQGAELSECILPMWPKGGYTWAFLRNQKYPTCGQSVERGVGTFQPQSWAHSINSWLTICSLQFALFSFQKVFSQQTFNLCHPPPFAAGAAIINNDSGFSGHHLNFPAACWDFNL